MELNSHQKAAIECTDHNLQIVACAGSGKTEVITRRIANILINKKGVSPKNIVAFTFTEKAAENMKQRVLRNVAESGNDIDISGMYVGTIHAFCRWVLNTYVPELDGFNILDTVKEHLFIMKYFNRCGAESLGLCKRDAALFSNCFDKMINAYDVKEIWPEKVAEVFEQYKSLLYEKGFLTFSLLVYEVLAHMGDPAVDRYLRQIRYLIVDEYQDIDDLQEKLIRGIVQRGTNICVVGDDDQTIYQFRGSNAANMISFANRYTDVVTVNLDINYRSDKAILDVANSVISNNLDRLAKRMVANSGNQGKVIGACLQGVDQEYERLIKDIKSLENRVEFGEMAILLRKRSRLSELTNALTQANIPFHAEESDEFFESAYYRKFCHILKYLEKQNDESKQQIIDDWKSIVNAPNLKRALRFLSRSCEKNERFVRLFEEFGEILGLDETHDFYKYSKGFLEILSDFDQVYIDDSWTVRTSDINVFIVNMAETEYQRTSLLEKREENAVRIMTVHQSKGLEFDAVFIPDLQQGFFPSGKVGGKKYYSVLGGVFEEQKDNYENDEEDERKLFYVALTRAKEYIYVYADIEKKDASLFLKEMNNSEYCNIAIPEKPIKNSYVRSMRFESDMQDYQEDCTPMPLWKEFNLRALRKDMCDDLLGARFAGGFGAAMFEYEEVKNASDEELLALAQSKGINIDWYRK